MRWSFSNYFFVWKCRSFEKKKHSFQRLWFENSEHESEFLRSTKREREKNLWKNWVKLGVVLGQIMGQILSQKVWQSPQIKAFKFGCVILRHKIGVNFQIILIDWLSFSRNSIQFYGLNIMFKNGTPTPKKCFKFDMIQMKDQSGCACGPEKVIQQLHLRIIQLKDFQTIDANRALFCHTIRNNGPPYVFVLV